MSTDPLFINPNINTADEALKTELEGVAPALSGDENPADVYVNSMDELKEKSPDFYDLLMRSFAQRIIDQSKRSVDRWKRIMKEFRR